LQQVVFEDICFATDRAAALAVGSLVGVADTVDRRQEVVQAVGWRVSVLGTSVRRRWSARLDSA